MSDFRWPWARPTDIVNQVSGGSTALDFDQCYRAVTARDTRFDGQFYTAVRTTGIYCRPSCPAITPKPGNVTFLPTAAAAQQAGYRACRRCLPDAAPGSPRWNTRADLAGRAMRLIGDGTVGIDTALLGTTPARPSETADEHRCPPGDTVFTPGIRVPGCTDAAELLLRTMIGQQISVPAANTHTARLVAALGEHSDGPVPRLFPTPAAIAEHGADVLIGPVRRIRAITAAAAALASGDLTLHPGRTSAEVRRDLLALDGVGPWTADYVTMRLLADPDIALTTDLVVRRGAARHGIDLTDTARWSPWRSYLSMQLWRTELVPAPVPTRKRVST